MPDVQKDEERIIVAQEVKPRRGRRKPNIGERNTAKAHKDTGVDKLKRAPQTVSPLEPDSDGLIEVRGKVAANVFAIFELHEGHPGGKLRIRGQESAMAWPTYGVMEAIHFGRLEIV